MNKIFLFFIIFSTVILGQYTNIKVNADWTSSPEEVSIAINPANPLELAGGSNLDYFYSSSDGGLTWTTTEMSSTLGVWGDPVLIYDEAGDLYFAHLSNPVVGYWIDRIVVQKSTDNGNSWNDGAGIGFNEPKNQDKEWLACDHSWSPYRGNIYMAWTEFDDYGSSSTSDSSRILFSRTTDHSGSWSDPVRISDMGGNCIDEDETVEGAVPAIGPDGEVYMAWSGPHGIMFDKSTDGGETFGDDIFVTDQPGGWAFDVPGIYRCNGMPITACDISESIFRGNVYVMWSDQRNGTDDTDVFFIKSTDKGETWGDIITVNNDASGRHQFFPWMTVDSTTGIIYSVFYDRRNTTGSATDVYMAKSTDGGDSWHNFKVSESSFEPTAGTFFGDYAGIAAYRKIVYPFWMRLHDGEMSLWTVRYEETSNVVPVELISFNAAALGNMAVLTWQTATEVNNSGFEIHRSRLDIPTGEKSRWDKIAFVEGYGTSTEPHNYKFIDRTGLSGKFSYMLVQVDYDGTRTGSDPTEVSIDLPKDFTLAQNYPNPFNPETTIGYTIPEKSLVTLAVFDQLGKRIGLLVDEIKSSGRHEVNFNASGLSSGIYFYELRAGQYKSARKMILLK